MKILLILALVLAAMPARTAPAVSLGVPDGWMEDVAKARRQAALQGKFVFMAFSGSDWCGWCRRMDQEVFSQSDFIRKASRKYVLVMIDCPQNKSRLSELAATQNPDLERQYRIVGYPSMVITDSKGRKVASLSGYTKGGPPAFLDKLDGAMAGVKWPTLFIGENPVEQGDLVPLFIERIGECKGELAVDDELAVSRRPVKSLNARNCDMIAVRSRLYKLVDELNAMMEGAGGNPAAHVRTIDALIKVYAKEAKLDKEELLETQIRLWFRLSKGFQSPDVRKEAEAKLASLKLQTKNAEDYIAGEELRLAPEWMELDDLGAWAVPKKLRMAASEGRLNDKSLRSAQAEALKTARKMQLAKAAVANAAIKLMDCETAAEAKKSLARLDGAVAACEKSGTSALGKFSYSANEKQAAKERVLAGYIKLLMAIEPEINGDAAPIVKARLAKLKALAASMRTEAAD